SKDRGRAAEPRRDTLKNRLGAERVDLKEIAPHRCGAWPKAVDLAIDIGGRVGGVVGRKGIETTRRYDCLNRVYPVPKALARPPTGPRSVIDATRHHARGPAVGGGIIVIGVDLG